MAATSVGGVGNQTTSKQQAPSSSTLSMDSFMQLLSIQLQNQDMNSPMSNSEMMQQLTSMATVQSMNTFTELSSTQYALGLMGQEVTVADTDDNGKLTTKTGKVTGINLSDMKIYLEGSKVPYGLGNVMEVGKVPEEEKKDDSTTDTDDKVDEGNKGPDGNSKSSAGSADGSSRSAAASGTYGTSPAGQSSETAARAVADLIGNTSLDQLPADKAAAIKRQTSQSIPEDKAEALARTEAARSYVPEDKMMALETQQAMNRMRTGMGPGIRA